MVLAEEPLSIVKQWKKKSFELSSQSNDIIASLITKGIDTMALVLNERSDPNRIQTLLSYLEYERSVSLQLDQFKNDVVRSLVYGLIESLHFTLSELTIKRKHVKECGEMFTQTEEHPLPSNNSAVMVYNNLCELPKEESFDESAIKDEDYWADEGEIKDEEMDNHDVCFAGDRGDLSSTVDDKHTIISSVNVRTLAKSAGNESLDNSHDDSQPLVKKSKTDCWKMKIKKSLDAIDKRAGSVTILEHSREMKCTECEFITTSACSFQSHLRKMHSTTLLLAGLALRCDCGVDNCSYRHRLQCKIANYTVVRLRDGPIQTINQKRITPKCLLCDAYPTTPYGYIQHLYQHHKSRLSAHGIWLLCECGAQYRSNKPEWDHTKECTRREYSLQKFADK